MATPYDCPFCESTAEMGHDCPADLERDANAVRRPALQGSTAPLTREERVWVMKRFLADAGPDKAAEFVINLQDSADGLGRNQREYEAHFARMYKAR